MVSHLTRSRKPPPTLPHKPVIDELHLIYDGLWFGDKFVLLTYRFHNDPLIIHSSIRKTERSTQIANELEIIKNQGYMIDGIVTDGGTGVIKAADAAFPFTPHQTCLAHVHRQATIGLVRTPKDIRTQQLRYLADHMWLIESQSALKWWLEQVKTWAKANKGYLQEYGHDDQASRWWFRHKNARKTVKVLL